jgi:hypothetical protein
MVMATKNRHEAVYEILTTRILLLEGAEIDS